MHRTYAAKAIRELVVLGFLGYGEKHTQARPRYVLTDWPTFAAENVAKQIESLSFIERDILNVYTTEGIGRSSAGTKATSRTRDLLVSRGILQIRAGGFVHTSPGSEVQSTAGDLIWLPNTLVQGAANEQSPLARLKAAGDVWSLRLLVDLYHAQNLAADGGVNKSIISETFERLKAGSYGPHIIWAFKRINYTRNTEGLLSAYWTGLTNDEFWNKIYLLQKMGVLQFVPHLMPNSGNEAEPIHAFGLSAIGEPIEQELGTAAHLAGTAMIWEREVEAARNKGFNLFAPVWNTLPDVQLVGVARLVYRPQTRLTADWHATLAKSATRIQEYKTLRKSAEEALTA